MGINLGLTNLKTIVGIQAVYGGTTLIWQNLAAPVLTFSTVQADAIDVSWNDTGADSYELFIKPDGGAYTSATGSTVALTHTETTLTTASLYHFYINATKGTSTVSSPEYTTATLDSVPTTDYMNAISIPNDSTTSIYNVPNSKIWEAINTFIVTLKTRSVYSKLIYTFPKLGSTAAQAGVELKDVLYIVDYFGSWIFGSQGIEGNGTNTHIKTGINFGTDARFTRSDSGVMVSVNKYINKNSNYPLGFHQGDRPGSIWIGVKYTSYNNSHDLCLANGLGTAFNPSGVTPEGIWSLNTLGTSGKSRHDTTTLTTADVSASTNFFRDGEIWEGAVNRAYLGTPLADIFQGSMGTTIYHKGLTDAEQSILYQALKHFETSLNRRI